MYEEKYDWRTREDAETLKRAQAIKNDPMRLASAREYLAESIGVSVEALAGTPKVQRPCRAYNKATIRKL